nr:MAG TPA: hypothetical protein [Caudoviricetes sp.]
MSLLSLQINKSEEIYLVNINQKEAEYLRNHGRFFDVKVCNKHHKSKGKSYFLVEHVRSIEMLNRYRESINQTDLLTVKPRNKDFRF